MKYLAARIEKPVWAPSVLTINELFRSFSLLQIPGNEALLFELYKVYDSLKKPHESFDEFYHWGDMLLNDFDDVDKYIVHFIGFNALNDCEKVLMRGFKKAAKARFYWDYDNSYIKESRLNSAGYFLRENIKMFGSDMPSGWSFDTMLIKQAPAVYRRVIDTSSDVAQVKLVSQLLEAIPDMNNTDAQHTAVVLADENLLMPVLTSLPENMGDINITMGHPLKQTLVYTLIRHLVDLHTGASMSDDGVHFAFGNVISILKHTLLTGLLKA